MVPPLSSLIGRGFPPQQRAKRCLHFHCALLVRTKKGGALPEAPIPLPWVLLTLMLAYMVDSLVRVSRRVDENHFVSISTHATTLVHLAWYLTQAETQPFDCLPEKKDSCKIGRR